MTALGMLERPIRPANAQRIVEDRRPNSGHLQISHPSPVDGLFEPHTALGAMVGAGDVLGAVTPLPEMAEERIVSQQCGLVVALATMRRVRKGDGLAVILEVDRWES
jgi:hypothetical protein